MEARLELKLSQKLIMTPQLQQAIKLLQLSRLELTQTLARNWWRTRSWKRSRLRRRRLLRGGDGAGAGGRERRCRGKRPPSSLPGRRRTGAEDRVRPDRPAVDEYIDEMNDGRDYGPSNLTRTTGHPMTRPLPASPH